MAEMAKRRQHYINIIIHNLLHGKQKAVRQAYPDIHIYIYLLARYFTLTGRCIGHDLSLASAGLYVAIGGLRLGTSLANLGRLLNLAGLLLLLLLLLRLLLSVGRHARMCRLLLLAGIWRHLYGTNASICGMLHHL